MYKVKQRHGQSGNRKTQPLRGCTTATIQPSLIDEHFQRESRHKPKETFVAPTGGQCRDPGSNP
jgi:hypothetical protein